jgi:transposase InsO family protein
MTTKPRAAAYTAAPEPPSDPTVRARYDNILAVIAGKQTVTGAARELGLSRNHFQTIMHRGIAALIEAITPKQAGRPAKPAREAELERENEQLRVRVEDLQRRLGMLERLMTVVGGIASGREATPRPRRSAKKPTGEDSESPARRNIPNESTANPTAPLLPTTAEVQAVRETKVPNALCARVLGTSTSTLGRRIRTAERRPRPSRRRPTDAARCSTARSIVRATHGLVGATNLAKRCGLSRREAAAIKRAEIIEMEHERKARCQRVILAAPGVVRGFDAMHIACGEAALYLLIASDAAIAYRTSIAITERYDAAHVIAALRADFETHGPPLVLRLDRIACQRTPEVDALLTQYGVLALHGPPRYPQYYGQLERQNRDHRAWLRCLELSTKHALENAMAALKTALNDIWPRPTLGWCTPAELWERRKTLDVDRRELRFDVQRRALELASKRLDPLCANRIAIESALTERGLLTINRGGYC